MQGKINQLFLGGISYEKLERVDCSLSSESERVE